MAEAATETPTATPAPAAATPPATAPTTPATSTPAAGSEPPKQDAPKEPTSLLAASKPEESAQPTPTVSLDDAKKYLADKGVKAEDLAKLDEAGVRAKYDEAKAAEAAAAPGSDIDVKLPDGVTIDEKVLADFKGIIADAKLSPTERAQKLVDMHLADLKAATEASNKLWTDTQKQWADEIRADKDVGGAKLNASRAAGAKLIDHLFPNKAEADQVRLALDFTGAGNNPWIFRAFVRAASALVEGGPVAGKPTGESGGQKSPAQILYGNPS